VETFTELNVRLASACGLSIYELHQRSRSLREETAAAAKQAMEARGHKRDDAALAAKRAATISGREAATLLAGFDAALSLPSYRSNRKGPGSALRVDAALASSFLISLLVGGPHRGIAQRTLDMSFASYAAPGCADPLCAVTGQLYLGDAVAALLSDRRTFDRTVAISVSDDRGIAEITFKEADGELVSRFAVPGAKPNKPFFRKAVLVVGDLPWLFDAVNDAPARAKELA
jgi:hypothetical protein